MHCWTRRESTQSGLRCRGSCIRPFGKSSVPGDCISAIVQRTSHRTSMTNLQHPALTSNTKNNLPGTSPVVVAGLQEGKQMSAAIIIAQCQNANETTQGRNARSNIKSRPAARSKTVKSSYLKGRASCGKPMTEAKRTVCAMVLLMALLALPAPTVPLPSAGAASGELPPATVISRLTMRWYMARSSASGRMASYSPSAVCSRDTAG